MKNMVGEGGKFGRANVTRAVNFSTVRCQVQKLANLSQVFFTRHPLLVQFDASCQRQIRRGDVERHVSEFLLTKPRVLQKLSQERNLFVLLSEFQLAGEMRDAAVGSKKADYQIVVFPTNLEPHPRIHFRRGHLALYIHPFNSWLAQTISALTASLRYDGALKVDVVGSQTICCFTRAFSACVAAAHRSSQRRRPTIFNSPGPKTPCLS